MHGGSKYVKPGAREPIEIQVPNRYTGKPLTGKTDLFVSIRRTSDNLYFDWADNTFKTGATAVTRRVAMSEVSSMFSPGEYQLDYGPDHLKGFDTSQAAVTTDAYVIVVEQVGGTDAGGMPMGFELHVQEDTTLPAEIADAVWGAMQADHKVLGSFGDLMRRIVALQKEHYVIDNMEHNAQGLLTAARIRLFENKADVAAATDGGTGEGEFATYDFETTPDSSRPALADVVRSVRDS
jgi:hypothetical protein